MSAVYPPVMAAASMTKAGLGRYHLLGRVDRVPAHPRCRATLTLAPDTLTPAALVERGERCGVRACIRWWPGPLPVYAQVRPGRVVTAWPLDRPPAWFVWWTLRQLQHGVCALCAERTRDWQDVNDLLYLREPAVIDHDHATGQVRGLVCGRCNSHEATCEAGDCYCDRYRAAPPAGAYGWQYSALVDQRTGSR